jgi:hypothetical protein
MKTDIKNRIIIIPNPYDTNHWVYREFFENGKDFNPNDADLGAEIRKLYNDKSIL